MNTMKAAVLTAPKTIRIQDVPVRKDNELSILSLHYNTPLNVS